MVMPDGEALSDVPGEATEVAPHALPDRLQRLEAVRVPGGMDADAVGRAVVDGDEHRRLTLAGDGRGQIGAPEGVHGTVSGMMVPAWARGPRGEPTREGARRPCSPISRSTRRFEVRTPAWRSRAQTFLCPSPWKGLAASTARTASASAASGIAPTGPGRRGGIGRGGVRCR